MAFLKETEPPRGVPETFAPGLRRVVANNPSPMTYYGTNTWLIDSAEGAVVIDPGPDLPAHVQAILAATGGRVARILLTHSHHDHLGGLAALKQATGAPTYGFRRSADPSFEADHKLDDGDSVAGLTAIHTPGHCADHLCFAWHDGILFSGDHVMGWSTSVVGPPGGNMADYFRSLETLLGRDDRLYYCGHGPPLPEPGPYVGELLRHRRAREAAIRKALSDTPVEAHALMMRLYSKLDPTLRRAAERNVLAHLMKLEAEGEAIRDGETWRVAA